MNPSSVSELLESALALHRRGALEQAARTYEQVLGTDPNHVTALKLSAVLALDRRDLETALAHVTRALAQRPADGELLHLAGSVRVAGGDYVSARPLLVEALTQRLPDAATALAELALCEAELGAAKAALASAERALALEADHPLALRAAAQSRQKLGRLREALELFDRLLARDPSDAAAWHASAVILQRAGHPVAAHARAERAVALAPKNAQFAFRRRAIASAAVPDWHFNMMNDGPRNASFAAAIERHVRPDSLVLEIGTGSGLLAMLAAGHRDAPPRARRVITCEGNTAIAEAARRIVAANGLADRVTVVPKLSTELVVGVDLPEPADVLISEIFSVQVTTEGVLPSFEDAKRRLLKPGARVLPERAIARGALVGGEALGRMARVERVLGFDLSEFNAFTPVQQFIWPGDELELFSAPGDLLAFELQRDAEFPPVRRSVTLTATRDGLCQGVVQWLRLDFDPTLGCEHAPDPSGPAPGRHWAPLWYPFERPLALEAGQEVPLSVTSNRVGLRVEPAAAPRTTG